MTSVKALHRHYPAVISIPRFTTLLVSLLVTLGSGTNYVYSAYAPQLGARLNISHTYLNIVGLAGNIGVYSTGPIWGRIVDARGPRIPMASSFILLLVGYSGIKLIFDAGVPPNSNSATISFFTSCVLILCGFMTGAGGNAGLTGAVNSTAKTFPDKARATTTGLVISGFGLSAFLFSTISRIHFAGNTSSFLGLLALGTSLPMIAGFFFVRPIPLPSSDTSDSSSEDEEEGTRNGIEIRRSREERDQDEDPERVDDSGHERDGEQSALLPLVAHDQLQQGLETPTKRAVLPQGQGQLVPNVNIYGRELWTSTDFLLLFAILSILAGTGLTYINNAGLMSQALYIYSLSPRSQSPGQGGVPVYDPIAAAHWQADQVASISLLNFAGRIFIGITTDTLKHHLSLPRSSALLLVAALFVLSQVLAALVVDDVKHLWIASATLGLAHGSVFSLFPNVCLEWFGMAHFSENWGYLSIAPIVFGNIFAVVFGRNLDAHSSPSSPAPSSPPSSSVPVPPSPSSPFASVAPSSPSSPFPPSSYNATAATLLPNPRAESPTTTAPTPIPPSTCTLGRKCYADALYLTLFACLVASVLSVWAGWRDRRRLGLRLDLRSRLGIGRWVR